MKSYINILSILLIALCFIALSKASINSSPLSQFQDSLKSEKCRDCVCGAKSRLRIAGGKVADRRNHPWLVQIKYQGKKWCGGSLVTRRHILTAAHCVHNRLIFDFTVHLADGEHEIGHISEHLLYNVRAEYDNDIAIIELSKPVNLSATVRTICLPKLGTEFHGKTGVVTGWGKRFEGDVTNKKLRSVELPILSNSECSRTSYYPNQITDNMFCAGFIKGGKDTCKGDSGGPLEVQDGASAILAGIVSWGNGCAREGYPGMYTKVSNYIEWIQARIRNECLCKSYDEQT